MPAADFPMDRAFTHTLHGCARCHGEHGELSFRPLTHPSKVGDATMTHWAICPTTGEPILFARTPQVFACRR